MTAPRFIEIGGKRFLWREIVRLRQEQCRAAAEAEPAQPPLFERHEDFRPAAERSAAARYLEPSLFSFPGK
jgi:hypothetical protein